ncbi:MAG: cell division protein FtsA [Patescibacteria group bacterium]
MSENIIAGLDIGSGSVRLVVGQAVPNEGEGGHASIHVIGAVEVASEGIHKGTITSLEDAVSSISKVIEMGERMTGIPIASAWVGIAGTHVLVQEGKGVVGVGRTDGEIREEDVDRAIEATKMVARPTNYDILHVIPKRFSVDNQHGIKDPVGMNGIRLEVEAVLIQALSSQMKNFTKGIYRTGLDIEDVVYAPLATAEALLLPRQKDLGVCLVNIGASSTSLIVFEEGDVLHTAVLPVGSDHITNDLAIGLRTAIEIAEEVKIRYGHALAEQITKKELIDLSEFGVQGEEPFERKFVAEIIQARTEEICERVDRELAKVERSGMLPGGIVLTGSGSKLAGINDVMKQMTRLPVAYGQLHHVTTVLDHVQDPGFSTAIGLVLWGASVRSIGGGRFGEVLAKFRSVDKVTSQMRKWLRSLIP